MDALQTAGNRTLRTHGVRDAITAMKTFHFHPASLLAGLAIGAGFLFLTSQTSTVTFPTARVEVGPHPRDVIQIIGSAPYTVPAGKILTITAIGADQPFGQILTLSINGQPAVSLNSSSSTASATSMHEIPHGLTAPWGSVITVAGTGGGPIPRAWGYLAER